MSSFYHYNVNPKRGQGVTHNIGQESAIETDCSSGKYLFNFPPQVIYLVGCVVKVDNSKEYGVL